jgi:hypothetical protein
MSGLTFGALTELANAATPTKASSRDAGPTGR